MTDYNKLVEALRCCAGAHTKPTKCPDYGDSCECGGKCLDKHLIAAAAAIKALQAEVERLTKENKELAADRPEMVEADGHWEWRKPNGEVLMPKRGEWIHGREIGKEWAYDHWITYYEDWRCSNCNVVFEQEEKPKYKYCPNCGAKMEVQEKDAAIMQGV